MAADPSSLSFFGAIGAGLAVIVSPILWIHRKLGEKANKEDTDRDTANCLRHIEKLYANAEADRALTRSLHERAMERVQENQTTIIGILAGRRE